MKRIAIFASGRGSNALRIIERFKTSAEIEVVLLISNRRTAPVLKIAEEHNIPRMIVGRDDFYESKSLLHNLEEYKVDLIVLAGFLWLIPTYLTEAYQRKIINVHPALLPKYGGKGMYGNNVHKAVKEMGDKETGITIHYVNEVYDDGEVIFQAKCSIDSSDQIKDIAHKVHLLEHKFFPEVIEKLLTQKSISNN